MPLLQRGAATLPKNKMSPPARKSRRRTGSFSIVEVQISSGPAKRKCTLTEQFKTLPRVTFPHVSHMGDEVHLFMFVSVEDEAAAVVP